MKLTEKTDNVLKNLLEQKSSTSEKLNDKIKDLQKLQLSYNLLVTSGKQGNRQKQRQFTVHPPGLRTRTTTIPVIKNPSPTKLTPPAPLRVTTISDRPNRKRNSRKRKHNVLYSTWNVDVDEIGVLPGVELDVSKSIKVFKKLDARQKKAHSKPTKKNSKKKTTKKKTRNKKSRKK